MPAIFPMNCIVKNRPACSSLRDQRAIKMGRIGPSSVVTIPASTNPARTTAFASHGLQAWEFDVLSALRRQGPPYQLSPGALLRATLVTSGTMTNRIDRLAEACAEHVHLQARRAWFEPGAGPSLEDLHAERFTLAARPGMS